MKFSARKLLVFGSEFLLILLLFALAWPFFAPVYNRVVATTVAWFAPMFEIAMNVTEVNASAIKADLYFQRVRNVQINVHIEYEYSGYFHFNIGLLLALFLSTPIPGLTTKSRLTLIALGSLVAFHIIFFLLSIQITPCVRGVIPCPDRNWLRWPDGLLALGKNLFPFLLWGVFTFRYWFSQPIVLAVPQPARALNRNVPCPCGSGKKYKRCCGTNQI